MKKPKKIKPAARKTRSAAGKKAAASRKIRSGASAARATAKKPILAAKKSGTAPKKAKADSGRSRPGKKPNSMAERRLAAEHAISVILSEVNTLGEAVPRILPTVCEALDWTFGTFWQVFPDAKVL